MSWLPHIGGLPRTYWVLWSGALVNRLGSFVAPYLTLYLSEHRRLGVARAGGVVSLYGLGSVAAGPVGGLLADRFGRRRTLVLSLAAGAAAMVALGFAQSLTALGVAATALGFFGELYRPAVQAAIADVVPERDRLRAYGFLYWAVNLGFAVAPVVAGALIEHSYRVLFLGDAATTLLFAVIIWAAVPETRPTTTAAQATAAVEWFRPYRDRTLLLLIGLGLLTGLLFYQGFVTLPVHWRQQGLAAPTIGRLLAINGALIVLLQPVAIALVGRYRRSHALATGALIVGLGFGSTYLAHSVAGYACTVAVWTLGEIVLSPVVPAVIAAIAPPALRGSYQGAYHSSWGAASFLGPASGAWVLQHLGAGALWGTCALIGVIIAAGYLTLAALPLGRVIDDIPAPLAPSQASA